MLGARAIWIIGNRKIFEDQPPTLNAWKSLCKQELQMLSYRMKKKWVAPFKAWLQLFFLSFRLA
jgi:hypothetical protein